MAATKPEGSTQLTPKKSSPKNEVTGSFWKILIIHETTEYLRSPLLNSKNYLDDILQFPNISQAAEWQESAQSKQYTHYSPFPFQCHIQANAKTIHSSSKGDPPKFMKLTNNA
jgi:hypothetical protein